jgi:hypothetical protein
MPLQARRKIALEFRKANNDFRPDALRDSPARRARKTKSRFDVQGNAGVLLRLSKILSHPTLYVAHAANLGLPDVAQSPEALYSPRSVDCWRGALKLAFKPPWFAQLEIDHFGVVHAHITAERGAHFELEGQPIQTDWQSWVWYLAKPHDARANRNESTAAKLEAEGLFIESKRRAKRKGEKLPRKSFSFGIPHKA